MGLRLNQAKRFEEDSYKNGKECMNCIVKKDGYSSGVGVF